MNLQNAVAIASVAEIFETKVVLTFRELVSESFDPTAPRRVHCSNFLVSVNVASGNNGEYSSCSDTMVARSDGFSLGFAFAGKTSFFFNTTHVYTIKKI